MVKTYHVMNYIKDSIEDNITLNEENTYISVEYLKETNNCVEVEFTDYGLDSNDKTKYRITVENID